MDRIYGNKLIYWLLLAACCGLFMEDLRSLTTVRIFGSLNTWAKALGLFMAETQSIYCVLWNGRELNRVYFTRHCHFK